MAVWYWFRRVILRRPSENEKDLWRAGKNMLSPKMRALLGNKKKLVLVYCAMAAEIIAAVIIFKMGGFEFIGKLLAILQ